MIQNFRRMSATLDSITVTWDELSCVDRNGALTGYRIEYGVTSFNNMETVTGTSFTATRLCPTNTYMFRVAAVNVNGTGPYSTTVSIPPPPPLTVTVSGSSACPLEGSQYTLTCTVSGHESLTSPSVTYQWLRGSSTVQGQSNNGLVFNPVGPDDSGTYTCRATVSSSILNCDITAQGSTTFSVTGMN